MKCNREPQEDFPWVPINTRLTDLPVPDNDDAYDPDGYEGAQYCAYVSWEPMEHIIHDPITYSATLVEEYWEYMQKADWNALKVAWQRHIYRFSKEGLFFSTIGDEQIEHTDSWGEPEEPEEYEPERHLNPELNNQDYHYVKGQISAILEQRFGISFEFPENLDS